MSLEGPQGVCRCRPGRDWRGANDAAARPASIATAPPKRAGPRPRPAAGRGSLDLTPVRWAMSVKGAQKLAAPVDRGDDGMTTGPTEPLLRLRRAN